MVVGKGLEERDAFGAMVTPPSRRLRLTGPVHRSVLRVPTSYRRACVHARVLLIAQITVDNRKRRYTNARTAATNLSTSSSLV